MKIVSRMIFAQIMKNSLFVLLTLVALFAFFDLIGQSGAMLCGSALVVAVRILSAHFRWNLPHAHD